jgi:hypothetical protein
MIVFRGAVTRGPARIAQKARRINREDTPRRNPGGRQAQEHHGKEHSNQNQRNCPVLARTQAAESTDPMDVRWR